MSREERRRLERLGLRREIRKVFRRNREQDASMGQVVIAEHKRGHRS